MLVNIFCLAAMKHRQDYWLIFFTTSRFHFSKWIICRFFFNPIDPSNLEKKWPKWLRYADWPNLVGTLLCLCVCVYAHAYVLVCVFMCGLMCTCVCMWVFVHVGVCTLVCVCMLVAICSRVYARACVHTWSSNTGLSIHFLQ